MSHENGARVAKQRASERVGGSGGAKPPDKVGLPAVARLQVCGPPSLKLRRATFASIQSEGWCAQHDSNVRPPGS